MSQKTLRMIYFSYIHLVMIYNIIFWGNSPHIINIFKIRKRIIRIIMNAESSNSCRELFKDLKILLLHSLYILVIIVCCKKIDQYKSNQRDSQYKY
jgi:hypothetical protein